MNEKLGFLMNLESMREKYSYGYCMYFAAAINRVYGHKISAQIDVCKATGDELIAHAYNVTPSGKEIDIYGIQDKVDLFSGNCETRHNMTEQDLINLCRGKNFTAELFDLEVKKAIKVIQSLPEIFPP